jgi:hypothetical protein
LRIVFAGPDPELRGLSAFTRDDLVRIRLFFPYEARNWQKGRTCRAWWKRGKPPPGFCDKGFACAYILAAVEPGTDHGFALAMPYVNTEAMQVF